VISVASTLYCPYCYRPFKEREIVFRCAGRVGAAGKKCETKNDRILSSRMGDNEKKYPVFSADGRKLSAECPTCKETTNYRLCPECHSQLPVHFGKVDGRMIALVGAKDSGKTVFVTVLLHELMHKVGRRFGASVLGADDSTRKRFVEDYEDQLYERRELHDTTRTSAAARGGRRPLVFSFAVDAGKLGRARVQRTLLSFFDTAGEDLGNTDSVEQNTRYLTSADGIILLLDPLQMRGARPLADPRAVLPEQNTADHMPANVLGRITDLLHASLRTSGGKRIPKPVAVAFSKMDALDGALPSGSPLRSDPPADAYFDEPDSLAVHAHVQELLYKWEGGNLDEALATNFTRYRFFGLSALGDSPVVDASHGPKRISELGIQPYRVHDPFLWLLSEFGTIPKRKKTRDGG
jgi:hypothetical protein